MDGAECSTRNDKQESMTEECKKDVADDDGFIEVKNRRNGGIGEKVKSPKYKPNTQPQKYENNKQENNKDNPLLKFVFRPKNKDGK